MSDLEGFYHQSGGRFDVLVERHSGRIIGSVGLRPMDGGTVELRKMYLGAAYRGRGLGKFLLEHALAESKRLGFRRVFLETATVLREALNLYRRAGFQQCEATHTCAKRCDMAMELFN
jgi:putative acetyltransferase